MNVEIPFRVRPGLFGAVTVECSVPAENDRGDVATEPDALRAAARALGTIAEDLEA